VETKRVRGAACSDADQCYWIKLRLELSGGKTRNGADIPRGGECGRQGAKRGNMEVPSFGKVERKGVGGRGRN